MKLLTRMELMAAGTWNRIQFTIADLEGIAKAFDTLSLAGRIPLKLSHEGPDARDDLLNKYALGWVRKVYVEGDRLLGDLEVPDKVAHVINEGYLKFVSVELLRNVQADTRVIPWVLDAVALLGSDQPAVGVLDALQALMQRGPANGKLRCESRAAFTRDDQQTNQSRKQVMTDAEIAKLQADLAAANQRAESLRLDFERKETERVKTECAERRNKVIALFDKAITDGAILPATKANFMANVAPEEGDTRWAKFDISRAEECIASNPKDPKKKFGRQEGKAGSGDPDVEAELEGMDESQKMRFRVNRYCEQNGIDKTDVNAYDRAVLTVFRSNQKASISYRGFATGESANA